MEAAQDGQEHRALQRQSEIDSTPLRFLCLGISLHSSAIKFNSARMYLQRRHWLDYDPIALAVLVIGIGIIELFALII